LHSSSQFRSVGAVLAIILLAAPSAAFSAGFRKQTYPFKFVDQPGKELYADVYLRPSNGRNPTIIFIHGGALMMGGRAMPTNSGSLLDTLARAGYAVVSIDYRLAPTVKLPAIIEDVQDACKWVAEKGPQLFAGTLSLLPAARSLAARPHRP
jgi:acetyl esterase/lipase